MMLTTNVLCLVLFTLFLGIGAVPYSNRQSAESPQPDCEINYICFALDQSGSIDNSEYATEQQFVVAVSRQLNNRTNGTQYSAYGFTSSARLIQASTTDLEGVFIPAILNTPRASGGTSIFSGLSACFEEIRSQAGNRVIVILTDGRESPRRADQLAPIVKNEGIAIVTVGIGAGADATLLRQLATTPAFFIDSSFDSLPTDVVRVANSSCDAVEVTPEPTPIPRDSCEVANDMCRFAFQGLNVAPAFPVDGPANTPFTPIIISTNTSERLGVLNTNRITVEIIENDGNVIPITALPTMQDFSPTQFKPIVVPNMMASGIGHESFQGDQQDEAKGRCVRVFFTEFQLVQLLPPFHVVANVVADREDGTCVVFRTM
eukprot:GFKZ01009384.1.p1 GENE.GFKZ01009384.1~~GFKZ01009384.1.p1  ORF type:complete len:375 (-),score=27.94 GFKZ01009384.1:399-1523(-)